MSRLFLATIGALFSGFRSQSGIVIENLALRQQLSTVLQSTGRGSGWWTERSGPCCGACGQDEGTDRAWPVPTTA